MSVVRQLAFELLVVRSPFGADQRDAGHHDHADLSVGLLLGTELRKRERLIELELTELRQTHGRPAPGHAGWREPERLVQHRAVGARRADETDRCLLAIGQHCEPLQLLI
jgi:hypothetical protein